MDPFPHRSCSESLHWYCIPYTVVLTLQYILYVCILEQELILTRLSILPLKRLFICVQLLVKTPFSFHHAKDHFHNTNGEFSQTLLAAVPRCMWIPMAGNTQNELIATKQAAMPQTLQRTSTRIISSGVHCPNTTHLQSYRLSSQT